MRQGISTGTHSRSLLKSMQQEKLFSEIYSIDAATNCYMIEIGLDQYADIFSEWDPAPFKRRSLDPDLELYLEGSSEEIPAQYPVELCFTLPLGTRNEHLEAESRQGLHNSFAFKQYLLSKQLKRTNVQILRFVAIGFIFLGVATSFSQKVEAVVLLSTFVEGLFIIGWVFLWEAVSLFLFTNRELHQQCRTYHRLQNAPIIFRESEHD